ncbi:hypothetical protein D3C76_1297660 [compost metagenome]
MHIELVRVDGPLHHHLPQALGAGDEDHVVEAGFGIQGEHDAGGGEIRAHHALHPGGEGHALVIVPLMHPVGDGAIVEEGGKHMLDGGHDRVYAAHVEEGLLLTREGGVRHVFGGGGGAHREGGLDPGAQLVVGGTHRLLQRRLEGGIHHPVTDLLTGPVEGGNVVHIQAVEQVVDLAVEAA